MMLNSRVSVMGTTTEAVPATRLFDVFDGVKVRLVVASHPLVKLLLKKLVACVDALASSVVLALSTMNRRPASTPESHACCSRDFTRYSRAVSTVDPASTTVTKMNSADIPSTLPRLSRASRARYRTMFSNAVARAVIGFVSQLEPLNRRN